MVLAEPPEQEASTVTTLPYAEIPAPPESYSATNVLSRIVDGLGFRYHWATEGLTDELLDYRPGPSGRSVRETLAHIHNIVHMVEHSLTGDTYEIPEPDLPSEVDVRLATLGALERVSAMLRDADPARLNEWRARFRVGEKDLEFPFWNTINGTMSDAIYHVGQIVSHRRAAGLPIDPHVNVFLGTRAPPSS